MIPQQKLFIRFKIGCWSSAKGSEKSNWARAFVYGRVLTYSLAGRAVKKRWLTSCNRVAHNCTLALGPKCPNLLSVR